MKKILITFLTSVLCGQIYAANIIFYENEEHSQYTVIPADYIRLIKYKEKKQELFVIVLDHGSYSFKVDSIEKAMTITKKLVDKNDSSLVELKQK